MRTIRELVRTSRPTAWINTGVPCLLGGYEAARELDATLVLATLYFLVPYNLLVYGVNDVYDYESDLRNPRKASLEGANVPPDRRRTTLIAIVATNVPLLLLLAALGGRAAAGALALAGIAAVVYSAPPLRTKERPVLDSLTSSLHFVLPAVCGLLLGGAALDELPWTVLAAFLLWGMASHALGAIQDVAYDRAAGIASVATVLGARTTAIGVTATYLVSGLLLATLGGAALLAAAGTLAYAGLALWVALQPDESTARRAWRSFMGLNLPAGALVTELLLDRWGVQADLAFASVAAGACVAAATLALIARRTPSRAGRLGDAQAFLARAGRDRLRRAADGNVTTWCGLALVWLLAGPAIPIVAVAALATGHEEALAPLAVAAVLVMARLVR